MNEHEQQQAAGSAIAAFTLAQFSFVQLMKSGDVSRDEAAGILNQAIEANLRGGLGNQYACQLLEKFRDGLGLPKPPAN